MGTSLLAMRPALTARIPTLDANQDVQSTQPLDWPTLPAYPGERPHDARRHSLGYRFDPPL
ncbi:hypothetical protein C1890_01545 [Pseudomonas sp. DP16D-R1]|nr:hypothetical protein C1890_01545 [Pseudomonas sp. DP16D-R1]